MTGAVRGLFQETMAGVRRALLWVAAFSLVINLLMLVPSLYMMQLYDRVLQARSYDTLLYLTLIAVGALAVLGVTDMVRARMLVRISTWIDRRLAGSTFERAIVAGLRDSPYQTRALQDLLELRSAMGSPSLLSLFDAPWMPLYLFVIWLLHPMLAVVAGTGAVVLFGLALLNERLTRPSLTAAGESAARDLRLAQATTRNAEAVEAMGMSKSLAALWQGRLRDARERRSGPPTSVAAPSCRPAKLGRMTRQMLQIMVSGADRGSLQQELTAGAMMADSIIMGRALAPVEAGDRRLEATWSTRAAPVAGCASSWRRPSRTRRGMRCRRRRASSAPVNIWLCLPAARRGRSCSGVTFDLAAGRGAGDRRPLGRRQVDAGAALIGLVRADPRQRAARRRRSHDLGPRPSSAASRLPAAGRRAVRRHGARQHRPPRRGRPRR